MRVKRESPVSPNDALAFNWDDACRKYFDFFEVNISEQRAAIQNNFKNILTKWRNNQYFYPNFKEVDLLRYRQFLGDISNQEVSEANAAIGTWNCFSKSSAEPAKINSYSPIWYLYGGVGSLLSVYLYVIRREPLISAFVPFVPLVALYLVSRSRPPVQELENAY